MKLFLFFTIIVMFLICLIGGIFYASSYHAPIKIENKTVTTTTICPSCEVCSSCPLLSDNCQDIQRNLISSNSKLQVCESQIGVIQKYKDKMVTFRNYSMYGYKIANQTMIDIINLSYYEKNKSQMKKIQKIQTEVDDMRRRLKEIGGFV